jgi:membrane protease YdiL (CAAX protease family)
MSAYRITDRDRLLATYPGHAFFFTMLAQVVYAFAIFGLAGTFIPGIAEAARCEAEESVATLWIMTVALQSTIFIHLTLWAERIGAGPFAGALRITPQWVGVAIIGAPILQFLALLFAFLVLSNGGENWAYRDDEARAFIDTAAVGPIMFASLVILAPLVEEIAFRGVALGCLLGRGVPVPVAILIQAVGFAALHLQYTPAAMFSVFVLGLFLGWLRVASKSIAVPILAHMAVNMQAVLALGLTS